MAERIEFEPENYWENPKKCKLRRVMGISPALSGVDQKMSRSFRKIVKKSCGVSLTHLWSCYKSHNQLEAMIDSESCLSVPL